MKQTILVLIASAFVGFSTNVEAQTSLSAEQQTTENYKRDQVNIAIWKRNNSNVKIVSLTNFKSRPLNERNVMLARGVLIYEGPELTWSDIQLFNQGQRPAHTIHYIENDSKVEAWIQSHKDWKIMSQASYNALSSLERAEFDALPKKFIFQGSQPTWAELQSL